MNIKYYKFRVEHDKKIEGEGISPDKAEKSILEFHPKWHKFILKPLIRNYGIYAITNGERIVGVTYAFEHEKFPSTTYTVGIVVLNTHQDRGIGHTLLSLLEKVVLENNINKLRAEIDSRNPRSLWVFIKSGYHIVGLQGVQLKEKEKRYVVEKELKNEES